MLMPGITYVEEFEPKVQVKVRDRFGRDIDALATLGFRELCFYREQFGLFSGILSLPTCLLMLAKGEVVRLHAGLNASASFILMCHNDPATVVVPLALGMKLYTAFADRTVVISTTFPSCALPAPGSRVVKSPSRLTLKDAWDLHRQQIRKLEGEGKEVRRSVRFEHYVEMSRQEEGAVA